MVFWCNQLIRPPLCFNLEYGLDYNFSGYSGVHYIHLNHIWHNRRTKIHTALFLKSHWTPSPSHARCQLCTFCVLESIIVYMIENFKACVRSSWDTVLNNVTPTFYTVIEASALRYHSNQWYLETSSKCIHGAEDIHVICIYCIQVQSLSSLSGHECIDAASNCTCFPDSFKIFHRLRLRV